jgi:hypothetical protein
MLINSIVELGEPRRAKQSAAPDGDRRLLLSDVRSRASRKTHAGGRPLSRSRVLTSGDCFDGVGMPGLRRRSRSTCHASDWPRSSHSRDRISWERWCGSFWCRHRLGDEARVRCWRRRTSPLPRKRWLTALVGESFRGVAIVRRLRRGRPPRREGDRLSGVLVKREAILIAYFEPAGLDAPTAWPRSAAAPLLVGLSCGVFSVTEVVGTQLIFAGGLPCRAALPFGRSIPTGRTRRRRSLRPASVRALA